MSEYRRVAENFIKLHDNPLRMKAKGVVDGVTSWKNLRRVIYHRLQVI